MASDDFSLGDRVQLKSGGPIMTVGEVSGDDLWCQWFAENEVKASSFKRQMLLKMKHREE
jgi:uncharacterized protein YodC (DUF2158 family)